MRKKISYILEKRQGQTMILVIGIMFLFMALSLTILLSASAMMGSTRQNAISTRCRMAASPFSQILGEEIRKEKWTEDSLAYMMAGMIKEDCENAGTFQYCADVQEKRVSWVYTPMTSGKPVGEVLNGYDIEVRFYWGNMNKKLEDIQTAIMNGETDSDKFSDLFLYTEVTCSRGKESWKVKQQYQIIVNADNEWLFQ